VNELLRTLVSGVGVVGLTGTASAAVSALTFLDERAPDPILQVWADSTLRASPATGIYHA